MKGELTHVAHIIDEDRRKLAEMMERNIYGNGIANELHPGSPSELQTLMELTKSDPSLLTKVIQDIQSANM